LKISRTVYWFSWRCHL